MHIRGPLAVLVVVAAMCALEAAPASAASCAYGITQWTNPNGGSWGDAGNWTNGVPSAGCHAYITMAGTYTVEVGKNLGIAGQASGITIGGASGIQTLYDNNSACGATPCASDTQLMAGNGGIWINRHGALKLAQGDVTSWGEATINGGHLLGDGFVRANYGVDNRGGRVTPTAGGTYDGVLDITGWYRQDHAATLNIVAPTETAGGHTAKLSTDGATFDGTLRISGPAPVWRRPFRAIDTGSAPEGKFSAVVFTGRRYDVDVDSAGAVLTTASSHCQSGATAWTNASGGDWFDPANWSNGVPSKKCDALITKPGTYTVAVSLDPGGGVARSVTVGAASGTQTLEQRGGDRQCSYDVSCIKRQMSVGRGGVTVGNHGQLRLVLGHLRSVGTVRLQGGRLEGKGDLIADHGVVNSGGTVAPVLAPGDGYSDTLYITGDYRQDHAATLDVRDRTDPAAGWFGVLYVFGHATLDGTLYLDGSADLTEPLAVVATDRPSGAFSTVTYGHVHYEVASQEDGVFIRPPGSTCTSGSTSWTNPDGGAWDDPANWSNGRPSAACDAVVTLPGDYGIAAGVTEVEWKNFSGVDATARSITLGGASGTQTISFSDGCSPDCSAEAHMLVGDGGITINPHGELVGSGGITVSGVLRIDGGTLDVGGGPLETDGGLVNGGHLRIDQSILRVLGSYRQEADGTLDYAFLPTWSGVLSVSGPVTLDGTLAVSSVDPYGSPDTAVTGPVIQADSTRTGTFADVTSDGAPFETNYDGAHGSVYLTRDGACRSGTTSWKGGLGEDWGVASNWTNGVPTSLCDVNILAAGSSVGLDGAAMARSLRLGRRASLTLGGAYLSMSGDYQQDAGGKLWIGVPASGLPVLSTEGSLTLHGTLLVGAGDSIRPVMVRLMYGAAGRTGTFSLVHPNTGRLEVAYDDTSVYVRNDTMAPVLRDVSARVSADLTLRVQFRSSEDAYMTVRVADMSGAPVASYDVSVEAGFNWFGFDVTSLLKPGRYRLTLVARDGSHIAPPKKLVIKVRRP